jgi:hypothetical protein
MRKDKTKVEEEKTNKKLHTQKCVDLGAKRFWSRNSIDIWWIYFNLISQNCFDVVFFKIYTLYMCKNDHKKRISGPNVGACDRADISSALASASVYIQRWWCGQTERKKNSSSNHTQSICVSTLCHCLTSWKWRHTIFKDQRKTLLFQLKVESGLTQLHTEVIYQRICVCKDTNVRSMFQPGCVVKIPCMLLKCS